MGWCLPPAGSKEPATSQEAPGCLLQGPGPGWERGHPGLGQTWRILGALAGGPGPDLSSKEIPESSPPPTLLGRLRPREVT